MEQNELFYATFPEARRAEKERRLERERLLTKYWQKLEYYGLPLHFGSPFFPRNMGQEGYLHDPSYVVNEPCTSSAPVSGPLHFQSYDSTNDGYLPSIDSYYSTVSISFTFSLHRF